MRRAAVVLAGGRSTRMGRPKSDLDWHGTSLLRRTVGIAGRGVGGPVLVVAAPGQPLPDLPSDVTVARDPVEGRGPLQGIAVGLARAAQQDAEVAVVLSVDLPLLHTAYLARVAALLDAHDVALPQVHGYRQPLAAAYRTSLAPLAQALCESGPAKPGRLFARCEVAAVSAADLLADPRLAAADPELASVTNVNDPDSYATALGRPLPRVTVRRFGTLALAAADGPAPVPVRAATVGQAAAAVGVQLDGHVAAAIDGDHVTQDPSTPLCEGDEVAFLAADVGG